MKIGLAQMHPVIGDMDGNIEKMVKTAADARSQGCDLVIFSEMVISGYPSQDLLKHKTYVQANLAALETLKNAVYGIGVICGYVDWNVADAGAGRYNSAALLSDGQMLGTVYKRLRTPADVFDDDRYFVSGTGNGLFTFRGKRIGITFWDPVWHERDGVFPDDTAAVRVDPDAELVVVLSASPFAYGKDEIRQRLFSAAAARHGVPLVYVNQVGGNDSVIFDGGSMAVAADGTLAVRAGLFEEELLIWDMDAGARNLPSPVIEKEAAIFNALSRGVRDYLFTCGFKKAVIGLSGGIDSALTAVIAADALGPEQVTTIFMPSRYTSQENYEDAAALAANLGTPYEVVPIDDLYTVYMNALGLSEGDEGSLTCQNIQARIRGGILMARSNQGFGMVLSTGNKSEVAVGYCTLYGDMCGGLSVISDIYKTEVYAVSRYVNRHSAVIPARIIDKPPSAELKPNQTDQDDLPEYAVLDAVLKAYIEDDCQPDEIVALGYGPDVVGDIIRRVNQSEHKRCQAAPGLQVSARAFGLGRRYPVAQRWKG
ncbi:MAG: NAD+ synthase [Deltaproteobacteria bacterium]|nr:MAG: NAD+ synthase [Deltaproteobacteria bacterium]